MEIIQNREIFNAPVAIYNADKKELIGIFKERNILRRYLYNAFITREKSESRLRGLILKGAKSKLTKFEFNVVARYASVKQIEILQENDFVIFNEYPQPEYHRFKHHINIKQDGI